MSDQAASGNATARPGRTTATVTIDPEAAAKSAAASSPFEMTAAGVDAGVTVTVSRKQGAPTANVDAARNKLFMEQVVVWPGDANSPGWINLHCRRKNTDPSKNGGKHFVIGWPFKTVNDLLSRASWVEGSSNFFDAWFCTSQQKDCGTSQNGKRKAVRKAQNATWLKAIWVDIDVKPDDTTGKHYTSINEAWQAICDFRARIGLPYFSAVVNSGGGLHIYWISDTPLAPDEWRPYAEGLKQLLLADGILCDTALTTDNVRILRVPGTLNHKYDPPRPATLVHMGQMYDFSTALAVLRGVAPTKSSAKVPSPSLVPTIQPGYDSGFENGPDPAFASLAATDDLAGGIVRRSHVPLDPGPIFDKCGFMRRARDTGGADYDNPLWMYTVLCATFLENGNAIAHEISKGHPTYAQAETQAMYERKLADRTERGVGWPSCATIRGAGCKSCAACPFLAQGKSPLHLTGPVTATVNPGSTTVAPATWSPADLSVSFSNIRHRRTLYGNDLVRGEITVLGSPGGVGKSSLAIGMAVSIAAGEELLDEKIRGNDLKVLLINAEDSTDEIRRRVCAFCLAHRVAEANVSRLYVAGADDRRVQGLSFLRTNEKGHSELDAAGLAQLRAALQSLSPDVLILDPFVALCASGNMNDNASMSLVMRALKGMAAEFDCAILIVHHTRKNAEAGMADAISGAASIVNLARRAIMPITVSAEEAIALRILPSEHLLHFKLVDAKSNLAPRSTDLPVYRLHSVELPNAEPPTYPFGDSVQAVVRVRQLSQAGGTGSTDDQKIRQAILDLVKRGKTIDGRVYPYSPNTAGAANERSIVEDAVAAARAATAPREWAPGDLEAVVKTIIKDLHKERALVSRPITGAGRFRRGQGLHADPALTTNGDTDAAETEVAT